MDLFNAIRKAKYKCEGFTPAQNNISGIYKRYSEK